MTLAVSPQATSICRQQLNCLPLPGFPGAPFLPQKSLWENLLIAVPDSAMWWLHSATSYPQSKTAETNVEMPGTKVAAANVQILHTDKGS